MSNSRETAKSVRAEKTEDGGWTVRSPGIGWWSGLPIEGQVLLPGNRLGRLECLHQRTPLVLGDGAAGVVEGVPAERRVPVEFGQPLFTLRPLAGGSESGLADRAGTGAEASDLPAGTRALVAPTDGVFYRRPSPDAAAFVEVGDRVTTGQPVGMVEVMKTFNQILYGGAGFPEQAEVVEIRCGDGEEVQTGQVLILVR